MILYLHSKCSTCQSAKSFLEEKKIGVIIKDIVKDPPTYEELQRMLKFQNGNIMKLLNTSGQLYKKMELSKKLKEMTEFEVLSLLSSDGMLVKRPFLLGDGVGLTGFKEQEYLLLNSGKNCFEFA
ncbi:MAG: Spx/MgsR family RNA polymerase-binding regulatory protein [Verrucomicrobia bacterium]|nr:Spx/MgsR family RNA polymerase-binding regulatory protein [Verrucomicrobiota bacterium]